MRAGRGRGGGGAHAAAAAGVAARARQGARAPDPAGPPRLTPRCIIFVIAAGRPEADICGCGTLAVMVKMVGLYTVGEI